MAVRFRYRRTAVQPLMEWMLCEACVTGQDVEGKMREATAFRMIQRNWKLFGHYHFRVTGMKEIERAEKDRLILVRFEHTFRRDRVVWSAYQAIAQIERTRRMVAALPQRVLRKICRLLPQALVTPRLRRLSYLEQPEAAQQ